MVQGIILSRDDLLIYIRMRKVLKILLLLLTFPIWFPLWVALALWATAHEYPESTYSED